MLMRVMRVMRENSNLERDKTERKQTTRTNLLMKQRGRAKAENQKNSRMKKKLHHRWTRKI
jgi:hypothetical protein